MFGLGFLFVVVVAVVVVERSGHSTAGRFVSYLECKYVKKKRKRLVKFCGSVWIVLDLFLPLPLSSSNSIGGSGRSSGCGTGGYSNRKKENIVF